MISHLSAQPFRPPRRPCFPSSLPRFSRLTSLECALPQCAQTRVVTLIESTPHFRYAHFVLQTTCVTPSSTILTKLASSNPSRMNTSATRRGTPKLHSSTNKFIINDFPLNPHHQC